MEAFVVDSQESLGYYRQQIEISENPRTAHAGLPIAGLLHGAKVDVEEFEEQLSELLQRSNEFLSEEALEE